MRGPIRQVLLLCLLVLAVPLRARAENNVILLMLDGVRWQEVFFGVDEDRTDKDKGEIFGNLWRQYMTDGVLYGNRQHNEPMNIGNGVAISLPGYQCIMAGYAQNCSTNTCGRIEVETLEERLVRELHLNRHQVATIASWSHITEAVEHVSGRTFTNVAFQPMENPTGDPDIARWNELQVRDTPPWENARYDKYTFAHAMRYLRTKHPRFLFISLNDSDEWGHKGDYFRYVASLRRYDAWIKELIQFLDSSGEYGANTTLLVTTDHGRGDSAWTMHGPLWPGSYYVWLYGRNAYTRMGYQLPDPLPTYSQLDIRPTIEAVFGLSPQTCSSCGRVMSEIVPQFR